MVRLSLCDLLNPEDDRPSTPPPPDLVDIRNEWDEIGQLIAPAGPLLVSPRTQQGLSRALGRLRTTPRLFTPPRTSPSSSLTPLIASPPGPLLSSSPLSSPSIVRQNIYLNRKTTLVALHSHPLNTFLEYPETSADGPVGHLFTRDPTNWMNPALSFTYSMGEPSGRSARGSAVYCRILVDQDNPNISVPCTERHLTCM